MVTGDFFPEVKQGARTTRDFGESMALRLSVQAAAG